MTDQETDIVKNFKNVPPSKDPTGLVRHLLSDGKYVTRGRKK